MTVINPLGGDRVGGIPAQPAGPSISPLLVLTGALAAALTVAGVFRPSLSDDALLPAMAVLFFALAAGVTLIAWLRPVPARHFSFWDVAGILTLVGIGAAAMVEPDQMVRLVAGTDRNP